MYLSPVCECGVRGLPPNAPLAPRPSGAPGLGPWGRRRSSRPLFPHSLLPFPVLIAHWRRARVQAAAGGPVVILHAPLKQALPVDGREGGHFCGRAARASCFVGCVAGSRTHLCLSPGPHFHSSVLYSFARQANHARPAAPPRGVALARAGAVRDGPGGPGGAFQKRVARGVRRRGKARGDK